MKTLKQMIEDHDHAKVVPMVSKAVLWISGFVLVGIVIYGTIETIRGTTVHLDSVVRACQALSVIAIAVLGWHGYTGHRLFHELRNWRNRSDS